MKTQAQKETAASARNSITEGVIWQQLLFFFFPILFGTFFQQLYNTVDAVIVGQYVGTEALAAVGGTTGTLINLFVGFFVGLSSGATVTISQFFGAGQHDMVSRSVHPAVAFSLVTGLAMMGIGLVGAPFALRAMGTPEAVMDYATSYLRIYFLGIIPNLVYNMGSGILRAIGDSKRPLYFLMASCFTNIVLDMLFVVYLGMEVAGAALATILSQLVSAVLVVLVLTRTTESYKLYFRKLKIESFLVKRIVQIGLPAGLQSVMYNASNITIQSSVNTLGTTTIAAYTAYSKIDSLFWMVMNAFGISITTFVGQNYGANKPKRVKKGVNVCLFMSFVTTILLSLLLYFFGEYIFRLFTGDGAVIESGMDILHFMVPMFLTYILIEIYSGSLRGIGDCWIPMILTCLGVCVLRVAWVLIAVPLHRTMVTILVSYPLSWTITSIAFFVYFHFFSRLGRKRIPVNTDVNW